MTQLVGSAVEMPGSWRKGMLGTLRKPNPRAVLAIFVAEKSSAGSVRFPV